MVLEGLPTWLSGSGMCLQCRRSRFDPGVRKISWKRAWQPTPVSLPGESHGQRSLVGYSPWAWKEWNVTEWTELNARKVMEGRGKNENLFFFFKWSVLISPSWALLHFAVFNHTAQSCARLEIHSLTCCHFSIWLPWTFHSQNHQLKCLAPSLIFKICLQ